MYVSRFGNEKNLTELVNRIFDLKKSTAKRAELAVHLAEANPHLDLKRGSLQRRLDKGTLIEVPEIAGAVVKPAVSPFAAAAATVLLDRANVVLGSIIQTMETADQRALDDANEVVTAFSSEDFKVALKNNPNLQEVAKKAVLGANTRIKRVSAQAEAEKAAVDAAHATIARLLGQQPK